MRLVCPPGSTARIFDRGGEVASAENVVRVLANAPNRLLVTASDGRSYVLKLYEDQTKDRALLRESLGTELAACLGLPVARWRPIYVSNDFISAFSQIWTKGRPIAGFYFGSEMVTQNPGERVYDYLPKTDYHGIDNRKAFIGMLLLDIWANNSRSRQAIFFRAADSTKFQAVFLGFKDMFSTQVHYSPTTMAGLYSRRGIYEGLWDEAVFSFWQRRIVSLKKSRLCRLISKLPAEWVDRDDVEQILSRLMARQKLIKRLRFHSVDPCSEPWDFPGDGVSISISPSRSRSLTKIAFGFDTIPLQKILIG